MKKTAPNKMIKIGADEFELTHPDKVLYPEDKLTKEDIVNYYLRISKWMLPHAKDRVLSMQHFPDGIKGANFYQKRVPDYFPLWLKTAKVKLHEAGGVEEVPVIEKEIDLAYLSGQAVLPFHTWLSHVDKINNPDKIVFDLDPTEEKNFEDLRFCSLKIKEKFESLGFKTFIMTSGAGGFHVCIPIKPTKSFDEVREFCHKMADEIAEQYPKRLTTEVRKGQREGRIFIDYLRNSYGQTSVCPYSLRALAGAPVATPFSWSEIVRMKPQSYNIKTIFKYLSAKGDPWKNFSASAKKLD